MKTYLVLFLLLLSGYALAKVPFATLYVEIKKTRYEGNPELLKNDRDAEKNSAKLDKISFTQKIWVDVNNDSYLLIEEPDKDNPYSEKSGRLKYKGRHYTLDFSAKVAIDETTTNKIFDNYTSEEPDYIYYEAKVLDKRIIKVGDGRRLKSNVYNYSYADQAELDQIDGLINEIKSSSLNDSEKLKEVAKLEEKKNKVALNVVEWIWVDEQTNEEMKMFLRKYEKVANVLTLYQLEKILENEDFDKNIYDDTLSKLKVISM